MLLIPSCAGDGRFRHATCGARGEPARDSRAVGAGERGGRRDVGRRERG
jgi:hypothetical protein